MHLYAALNHTGGPGWLLRAELPAERTGATKIAQYSRLCAAPVTSLEASADGSLLAAGNSEGEVYVVDSSTLRRLLQLRPHELFVTTLLLIDAPARVIDDQVLSCYALLSCSGDNLCRLSLLSRAQLEYARRGPFGLGLTAWQLACLLAFVACLLGRPFFWATEAS